MGKLLYGTAYDGKVRFSAIDSKDLVMEAERDISSSYLPLCGIGQTYHRSCIDCSLAW